MYDLAIIGAGWAGFHAAQTAKKSGLKICLIEKSQIGGTCLNSGCIPTKALIHSAKAYTLAKESDLFGLETITPAINFLKAQERKDRIIQQLRSGMQFMLKGIDYLNTPAEILSNEEIRTKDKNIKTKSIIIATGSKASELAGLKFDGNKFISSDDILGLKEIPGSLLIIGGGVIGCEFASLFSALGTKVSIVEKMPQLLPGEDKEIAKKLENIFRKKGIKVNTNTGAETQDFKNYDLVLIAVGRAPNTEGLGLDKLGVKLEKNKVLVDEYLKTNIHNIYAAGDVTGKIMLAHFAAYQGRIAAENITAPDLKITRCDNIPNCIFTSPEIASVGIDEEAARNKGINIKIYKFDFLGSGMARILEETEGFIKIISDKETQQVIGASIIGPRATELIGILTLAVSEKLKIPQIRNTILAHPTLSEAITDALRENYGI
ncbi:MAG: dihydrolipoyl dehydrogenase [Candidatus Omnitrophica bacterium]|nr:dihydrolipoyl dehydrogenase [Candidatus Omnitrophota bacterium]